MEDKIKKQGFEDDPNWKPPCLHPEHRPPMYLYIPPGKIYHHICPGCGKETILRSPSITY